MFKKIILSLGLLTIFVFSKSPVEGIVLSKAVFEEKIVVDSLGHQSRKMVPVKKVDKGAVLVYVNQLINKSSAIKKEVVVDNPIPQGTTYISGTSSCEGFCKMLYSIDGGQTYKESQDLFVIYGAKKRQAMDYEYTHIKFIFLEIPPMSRIRMAFKAKLK